MTEKLQEWAMSKAAGVLRHVDAMPSEGNHYWVARALAEAERRGIERAANMVEAHMLCGGPDGVETLLPRSTSGNKVGLAYASAIRQLGDGS